MKQIELERLLLVSLTGQGIEGYKKLPMNIRASIFSIRPHQEIFTTIGLLAKEKQPIDNVNVAKMLDSKLQQEFGNMIAEIPVDSYLSREELEIASQELIRRAEQLSSNNDDGTVFSLQKLTKTNPAQDFVNGVFVYAIFHKDQPALITSTKMIIPFADCKNEGIDLTTKDVDMLNFSQFGIQTFMRNHIEVNINDIFTKIRGYIKRYILLKDEAAYSFLALWSISTYVFRIFRYYPYVHLIGEKACGKTLLMEILSCICFNGELTSNATPAVLYRDVHNNSLTMFLDEVENLRKQDQEQHGVVMSILKVGFAKGGCVKRCVGQKMDKIQKFNAYSPKMLAGIRELDDVLQDRTVKIRMVRRLRHEKVDRYIRSKAVDEFQSQIRDLLYTFGLSCGSRVAELYVDNLEKVKGLDHLSNRELDIWSPIIVLANMVDIARGDGIATVTDAMVDYSKKQIVERRTDNERENDTVMVLNVLSRMIKEIPTDINERAQMVYTTQKVFDFFKSQDEFDWLESKHKLTRLMNKIEVITKTMKIGGRSTKVYIIDREKLKDYTLRFIPPEDETVTVTESVTNENV